jgi:DNA-binding beta-propeller fold protein YncE
MSMRVRFAALALTVLAAAGIADAQNEDWIRSLKYELQDHIRENPAWKSLTYKAKFCIDKSWVQLTIMIVVGGSSTNPTNTVTITTKDLQQPCTPSLDENGNPLPNDETITTVEDGNYVPPPPPLSDIEKWSQGNTGQQVPIAPGTPRPAAPSPSDAAGGFMLLTPYRDVPFTPHYEPAVIPSPPDCDPARKASSLIVNHGDGAVTRVASCSGQLIATIPVMSNPLQVAQTPDATMALVTSFDGALSFIDLGTNKVVFALNLSKYSPSGLAISPDGSLAYVTSFDSATAALLVINIASRSVVQTIPLTGYPQSVFLTPDGALAYVTDPIDSSIAIVDLLSGTVNRQLAFSRPIGIAFNAQATQAWIATGSGVVVLDTATYRTIQTVPTGAGPSDIRMTPDNNLILVNNFGDHSFSIVDPVTFAVQTFPLSGPAMGLTLIQ